MAFMAPVHMLNPITAPTSLSRRRRQQAATNPSPSSSFYPTTLQCSVSSNLNAGSLHSSSYSKTQNNHSSFAKPLALSAVATGVLCHIASNIPSFLSFLGGGGGQGFIRGGGSGRCGWSGGGGGGGGGGGESGGGGSGNFWSRIFSPRAEAKESDSQEWDPHGLPADIVVPLKRLSGLKNYKISEIKFYDQSGRTTVSPDDFPIFKNLSIQPGGIYTKSTLLMDFQTLATCGLFDKVDLQGNTKPDGTIGVTILFNETRWKVPNSFRCISVGLLPQSKPIEMDPSMTQMEMVEYKKSQENQQKWKTENARPCLLPVPVHQEIMDMLREQLKSKSGMTTRLLHKIQNSIEKWYHNEGYTGAHIVNIGFLNSNELIFDVNEGDITQVNVKFHDKLGNICEGHTQVPVITRELPSQLGQGHVFNIEAAKLALRNINSLQLFSNIEFTTKPDENIQGGLIVEINLQEGDQKNAEVSTEWNMVPGENGLPSLVSIQPGGTVSVQHRNIKGLNRSFTGSITTSNFLNPQDDLGFQFEYSHPYLDGVSDPRNRTLRVNGFNAMKLSPVFTGGLGMMDEVPPIWVSRTGIKANVTENLTAQSKFTYGIVMENITTFDEDNRIVQNGQRKLPSGLISVYGPPTTLSGTGNDQMLFGQVNLTRDNTRFVNGAMVGERNIFQLDQGFGIGSKFPFFNRHQLTCTRFLRLKEVEVGAGKPPPPVLVLHGKYGGCIGDLPSYDAFILGGHYSVRGYNMGEIGACRNLVEVAAELRIPVKNTEIYAFAEHGNDLGSSKDVKGNPTKFYRRLGHGSSYGVGIKLGKIKAEYAVDHNSGTGAIFLRVGERF